MKEKIKKFGKKMGVVKKTLDEQIEELMKQHLRGFENEVYIPHWQHDDSYLDIDPKEERILDYKNKKLLVIYRPCRGGSPSHWIIAGFVPEGKYRYKKNALGNDMTEVKPIPASFYEEIGNFVLEKWEYGTKWYITDGSFDPTTGSFALRKDETRKFLDFCYPCSDIRLSYYHRNKE